jgi:hypothetical protein
VNPVVDFVSVHRSVRRTRPSFADRASMTEVRIKALHDIANLEHADDESVLAISLAAARVTLRAAEHAMQEHIAQDGCKI